MRVLLLFFVAACTVDNTPGAGSGPSGSTGVNGTNGQSGSSGQNGAAGASGPSGAQGPSGPAGSDAQSSGARIKAQFFVGADGSRLFRAMHDTLLDKDVYPVKLSDGKLHWAPSVTRQPCSQFTDSGCADRVCWKLFGDCFTEGTWSEPVPPVCGALSTTHLISALGALVADNVTLYQYNAAGACAPVGTTTGTAHLHYVAGTEILPSTFVEATVETK